MPLTFSINEQAILGLVASDFSYKADGQIALGEKLRSFPDNALADEHSFPATLLTGLDNSLHAPTHRIFTASGISVVEFDNWVVDNKFNDDGDGYGAVVFRSRFADPVTNKLDYIVAFRGTDGTNAQDWYANLDLAKDVWGRQSGPVMSYLLGTGNGSINQATLGHIQFTGQSLGGALAQYAAYTYANQRGAAAFHPEAISLVTFNSFGGVRGLQQLNGTYDPDLLARVETAHFVVDNDIVHRLGAGDPNELAAVGGSWHVNGKDNTYQFDFAQKDGLMVARGVDGRILKLDMVSAHRIEPGFYAGFENFQNSLANFNRPNRIEVDYLDTPTSRSIAAAMSRVGNKGLTTEASARARVLVGLVSVGIAGDLAEIRRFTRTLLDNYYASADLKPWEKAALETLALPATIRLVSVGLVPAALRSLVVATAIEETRGLSPTDRSAIWDGINSFLPSDRKLTRIDVLASTEVGEREKALMHDLAVVAMASYLDDESIDEIFTDPQQREAAKALAGVQPSAEALQAAFTSGSDWLRNALVALQQDAADSGTTGEALTLFDAQLLAYLDGAKGRLGAGDPAFQEIVAEASAEFITEDFGWALANAKADFSTPYQLASASVFEGTTFDFISYDRVHDALVQAQNDPRYAAIRALIADALEPIEIAGQTVVASSSHAQNPFEQAGFDPSAASLTTLQLQEGQIKSFAIFLPYAAQRGGQRISLALEGAGAGDVALLKGAQALAQGSDGRYEIVIPEGQREYALAVAALKPIAAGAPLSLSATLVDQAGMATHLQNVELSADLFATAPPSPFDRTIAGDLTPVDFNPDTPGVQTQTDDLGNVITDPAQPQPGRTDILFDSAGNDDIQSFAGNDVIDAFRGGNDRLDGGAGRDIVSGRAGDDIVIGGTEGDLLRGDDGNDRVYGDAEVSVESVLAAQEAPGSGLRGDFMDGGSGDDTLIGGADNDALNGGAGGDLILGGAGDDDVDGDLETSVVSMDWSITREVIEIDGSTLYNRVYNGVGFLSTSPGGDDVVYGGAGSDWLFTREGNDWIDGGTGDDVVFGEAGNDDIFGGDGDDKLFGDSASVPLAEHGNDYLDGGSGNDTMNGDGGDDVLFGGDGNDQMFGDSTLVGGNDYLDGEAGDDLVLGAGGDDEIFGGEGADFLQGDSGTGVGDGDDFIAGEAGDDTLFGEGGDDELDGGDGDDFIAGNAGRDTIAGGAGNDTLVGDEGDGMLGEADVLDGGEGDDIVLGDGGDDVLSGGAGFDQLQGGAGNDALDGGSEDDVLFGEAGDDTLVGGAGNDYLIGGSGDDMLAGGDGDDVYFYASGDGRDRIADSGGTDFLVFTDFVLGDLRLDVGSLKIVVPGGEVHLDDFDPDEPFSGSIEYFQFADSSVYTRAQVIQALGFRVQGTPNNDALLGSALGDSIQAFEGDDAVLAGAGNDTVDLGMGDDFADGGDGDDVLSGGDGDDSIAGGAGADAIDGGSGSDYLLGEAGVDHLVGGDGDDWLAGGPGNDQPLDGGPGNDTYLFGRGDGQDVAVDTQGANGVQLLGGLTGDDVALRRVGNDLVVQVNGTTDRLTARDWFADPAAWNQLVLGDGTLLDRDAVQAGLVLNQAPVLADDAVSLTEDTVLTASGNLLANDADPEGRALRVTSAGTLGGAYGTLTLAASGAFSYSLNNASGAVQSLGAGQRATDPFTYFATDDDPAGAASASAQILFTIHGTNDAPTARGDFGFVQEDGSLVALGNVLANDSDIDVGDLLLVGNPGARLGAYGTLTLSPDGSYRYDLDNASPAVQGLPRFSSAIDRFAYSASDGVAASPADLEIFVDGANDAPVVSMPLEDQSVRPGGNFLYQIPAGSFTDIDQGDELVYDASLADGSELPAWLFFDAPAQTFSGQAPRDATGFLDIAVDAADGDPGSEEGGLEATDVFRLTFEGGGGSGGGGGGGGGGHGNEGVGNGEDPPPPGHDFDFNDGPGTAPGEPGAQGGNGLGHVMPALITLSDLPQRHELRAAAALRGFNDSHPVPRGRGAGGGLIDPQAAEAQAPAESGPVPVAQASSAATEEAPADGFDPVAAQLARTPQFDFAALLQALEQGAAPEGIDAEDVRRRWARVAAADYSSVLDDLARGAALGWPHFGGVPGAANAAGVSAAARFTGLNWGEGGPQLESFKGLSEGFASL